MDHEVEAARWAVEFRGNWRLAAAIRQMEDEYDAMTSNLARGAGGDTERLATARQQHEGFYEYLNDMMATARESIHRRPFPPVEHDEDMPRLESSEDRSASERRASRRASRTAREAAPGLTPV